MKDICSALLKQRPTQDYDCAIISLLKRVGKPLPCGVIASLISADVSRVSRRLKSLEKYGIVFRATKISGFPLFSLSENSSHHSVSQLHIHHEKKLAVGWQKIGDSHG